MSREGQVSETSGYSWASGSAREKVSMRDTTDRVSSGQIHRRMVPRGLPCN